MLDFFRKYQRYFFVVIAVVIVISFSFFGTHQTINQPQKVEDRCIGQAVDGSKMMKSEVDQMIRFIWSDRSDITLAEKGIMPNFFNDGVIRKDLMGTGIGTLLVNAYFEDLQVELQEKMERHKNYHPYVHPTAPFISVKNLWAQVLPAQKMNLERFLDKATEMTPETFSLLVDLYLGETAFPPHILREYLMFQEKHYDWIQPDPALP
ncbi:MAG: SurA N-terminal domain-containing protein, partial [Chlamydiales bacterium]|nr:SurA N-terminal domain-containing protein [Chlamydiales bacterium]